MTSSAKRSCVGDGQASWISGLLLSVLCVSLCAGCVPLIVGAAGGVAGAVYVMGKLSDELPYEVQTVHRAVLAALQDLDLTPSADKADRLSAHVESEFSDGEHVWINLDAVPEARTKMTIRVGITGNEMRARKIHEAVHRHLPQSATVSSALLVSLSSVSSAAFRRR